MSSERTAVALLEEPVSARAVRLVFGFALCVAAVVVGFRMLGGDVARLITLTSFLFILGGVASTLIVSPRAAGVRWGNAAVACFYAAVIGNVIGMIHVMENLDKPQFIGAGVAVSFVVTIYAVLGWALFRGIGGAAVTADNRDAEAGMTAMAAKFLLLFSTFVVLYVIKV